MKRWYHIIISCALLLGTLVVVQFRSHGEAVELQRPLAEFPEIITGWRFQEGALFDDKTLSTLKLSEYIVRRYTDQSGRSVWLYVGYWDAQRKGAQIHSPKHCLPGSGWEPLEASRVVVALPASNGSITVNRYLIQKDHHHQLATYWYHSQGRPVASEVDAKLLGVKNAILHNRTDGALVRLLSPIYGNVEQTFEMQAQYIRSIFPHLVQHLPRARGGKV